MATLLTTETVLSLPASGDEPTGALIVISGNPVKTQNGTFRLYSVHNHCPGQSPLVFWKRINTKTGQWSAGGNVSRNFKGENLDTLNAWIAAGQVTITA